MGRFVLRTLPTADYAGTRRRRVGRTRSSPRMLIRSPKSAGGCCLTSDGLGNPGHGPPSAGVAWRSSRRNATPTAGHAILLPSRRRWTSRLSDLRSARGALLAHLAPEAIQRSHSARMGVRRAPPGSVAQVERPLQSAVSPHELPLPDEGRTARAHDTEMRVQAPPTRAFLSAFDRRRTS